MAKVRGPLFSVGASGTVGDLLTFNPGQNATVARSKPRHYPPATTPQETVRQQCRDAAAAWHALDLATRNEWSAVAKASGRLPFAKYLIEWNAQNCTPQQPPFIPFL